MWVLDLEGGNEMYHLIDNLDAPILSDPPITLSAIAEVTADLNFLILCPLSDILVNGVHKPASNDQQSMKAFGQISEDFCIVLATLLAR